MKDAASVQEDEGGVRAGNATFVPESEDRRVRIEPFPLRALAWWGVVLFAAAFVVGRQFRTVDSGTSLAGEQRQAAASQTTPPPAALASAAAASPPVLTSHAAAASVKPTGEQAKQAVVVPVEVRLMKFNPATVELNVGDTVEWKNRDLTPHTATAENKSFDSGSIDANASWRYTFAEPGSFPYVCTFHPEMKGTVIVK